MRVALLCVAVVAVLAMAGAIGQIIGVARDSDFAPNALEVSMGDARLVAAEVQTAAPRCGPQRPMPSTCSSYVLLWLRSDEPIDISREQPLQLARFP